MAARPSWKDTAPHHIAQCGGVRSLDELARLDLPKRDAAMPIDGGDAFAIDDTLSDPIYDQERMLQHEIEDLPPV